MTDSKGIRVLIAGLAKSGTTILTYRVASCYDKPKVFFEPGKAKSLHDISIHREIINLPREIVITKSLFSPKHPSSANQIGDLYDKKIWIYRDPRDWIISRFFYQWRKLESLNIEELIQKIRYKENNPSKTPFLQIGSRTLINGSKRVSDLLIDVIKELPSDWLIVRYEDFVKGKVQDLNDYLGVTINTEVQVEERHKRVARSKYYGDWRNWFTDEDVDFFKPLFSNVLNELGYDDKDWKLNYPDKINAEKGSEFLLNLYNTKINQK